MKIRSARRGGTRSSPRVLCISPLFPPAANAESFCGGKVVRALVDAGLDMSVVHCSNILGRPSAADRSSYWDTLATLATDLAIPSHHEPAKSLLLAVRYRTESYVRWIDAVVRWAIREHATRKFDLIYSRSLPAVAHVAGYWCAQKLDIPWIVNLNDPWDSFLAPGRAGEGSFLHNAISTRWFKRTLRRASVVMYPTERLHRYHAAKSHIDRSAVIVPHVGYAAPAPLQSPVSAGPERFHIVHAGKLGSHEKPGRPVDSLLGGLSEFLACHPEARSATQLTLVGPDDCDTTASIAKFGLQSIVKSVGPVSYEESLRHIASSTICVLVEAEMSEGILLPSKLADYISARKPVLALSPVVGVARDLAAQGGIAHVGTKDPSGARDAIADLYSDLRQGRLGVRAPSERMAAQFKPEAVAKGLAAAIATTLGN